MSDWLGSIAVLPSVALLENGLILPVENLQAPKSLILANLLTWLLQLGREEKDKFLDAVRVEVEPAGSQLRITPSPSSIFKGEVKVTLATWSKMHGYQRVLEAWRLRDNQIMFLNFVKKAGFRLSQGWRF